MDFKSRLLQFIQAKGLSVAEFERRAHLSNGYVKNFKASMRPAKLAMLFEAFPELNRVWLLTGEGNMFNSQPDTVEEVTSLTEIVGHNHTVISERHNEIRSTGLPNVPRNGCFVPLYNIDSVGGMDVSNLYTSSEEFIKGYVPFPQGREGDIAIVESGDSMSPVLNPGCYLLLRPVENWREYFGFGHVFVLLLSDGRRITKRVVRYSPDPVNYVLCRSENERYPDEELPKSLIVAVWRVISSVNSL